MAKEKKVYTGTGRRKTSVARVTLMPGTGKITVNGRDVNEYFPYATSVMDLTQPLEATNTREIFDVEVKVTGGGLSGQAGATKTWYYKSIIENTMKTTPADSENSYRKILKKRRIYLPGIHGKKERKKPGTKESSSCNHSSQNVKICCLEVTFLQVAFFLFVTKFIFFCIHYV